MGEIAKSKDGTKDYYKTTYRMLGASNHTEKQRQENDYYATEPKAAELLLEKEQFSHVIWENAVGEGHLAEVFKKHGYSVKCSDIIDRGYPNTHILNFLDFNPNKELDLDIITNPPYKYAKQFIEKALQCVSQGHKVAMFLKLQFLESRDRKKFFETFPPKTIYVASGRLICAMNGEFEKYPSSAIAYAWFVWEKGYQGEPVVRWIN